MQPTHRVFRALAREGLTVTHDGPTYTVRLADDPHAPCAEVLLPAELPLEAKALHQLANLAAVRHPGGGAVCRACATPDFHPGDSGVAIGSVVETRDIVIPQAIGTDINCGMRLHVADLDIDWFLRGKARFVELLKGDYLLGTRDVVMQARAATAMFTHGVPGWVLTMREGAIAGSLRRTDWTRLEVEADRILLGGGMDGDAGYAPESLVPEEGWVRDDGLATIGRGNHFVEVQVVEEVVDRHAAWNLGVRAGQVAFMIHSGSRSVGLHVGATWKERARAAWPKGVRHPESGLFPISLVETPELAAAYLRAEATAANYAFVNRLLLAELLRHRLEEVYGDVATPLVYDIPHNVTLREGERFVTRKGACPAYEGVPVIIPGSMGSASFLCVGKGNPRFLASASHGAGRSSSRGEMGRAVRDAEHLRALGLEGVECITLRDERRVEEAPAAYKPIGPVIASQVAAGVVDVVARMRPILTFKG